MPVIDVAAVGYVGLGGLGGGGISNDELVLEGLFARSKLSPLTLCPGFGFPELLEVRLGLRAGGPRIAFTLSGSP